MDPLFLLEAHPKNDIRKWKPEISENGSLKNRRLIFRVYTKPNRICDPKSFVFCFGYAVIIRGALTLTRRDNSNISAFTTIVLYYAMFFHSAYLIACMFGRQSPPIICIPVRLYINIYFFSHTSTFQLLDEPHACGHRCRPFSLPVLAINFYRA